METKKKLVIFIELIIIVIAALYIINCIEPLNQIKLNEQSTKYLSIGVIIIGIIVFFYIISLIKGSNKTKELKYKDKLFNSLVKNSDTIYIMYDCKTNKVIYMTQNVEEILGIKNINYEEDKNTIYDEIFNIPVLKEELKSWSKLDEFVSQMITYKNSNYQHETWIKVKIYPFIDRKTHYNVILVSDATREHDQQHLLVSQASDIKSREKQLDQITSSSYDTEITINLFTKKYTLTNLKEGIAYFGNNTIGNYQEEIEKILNQYIDSENVKEVKKLLSEENLTSLASTENYEPTSFRYKLKDSKPTTWLESTIYIITTKDGSLITILTKDVTENAEEIRKQNVLLQSALKEAKEANTAKTKFLEIMSHEIRTPMNVIIGLSESALSEEITNKAVKEDLENIETAGNNLLNVIDGILDIKKIESGKDELEEKEYNTSKLFKDIILVAKQGTNKKKLELKLNIDKEIPSRLFGDKNKIYQVLISIINNAITKTENGYISIEAKINKSKNLTVKVEDTGIGYKKDELENLFDNNKNKNMDLNIVQNLINILKGTVEVESTFQEGTTFIVNIPQEIIDEKPIGDILEYKELKKTSEISNLSGKKILIVDDDKLNLKVATRLITPYQAEIITASSGKETIELIKENNFDLILLDQMMPEMSGTETLKKLKENTSFKTPVIVLTADAIKGKKEQYLSEGFNDYLSKPIEKEELTKILNKYLQK